MHTSTVARRSLSQALLDRPLLFEPVPPSSRTSEGRLDSYVQNVVGLLGSHPRVDAFVVPELVSENHNGEPHYRSGDVRAFASQVSHASGCESVLNKVVAHLHSTSELEGWCRGVLAEGIRNVMFIGGTSRFIPYPGPSVAHANASVLALVRKNSGLIGNVLIPHRAHEGYRMLTKTRSGASFFTTQILFEPESIVDLLHEYGRLCWAYEVTPATVVLSLAPVADEEDLEFVRWLGAEVPERVERRLVSEDGSASVEEAVATWRSVVTLMRARKVEVPLGVNVEVVSPRHFSIAVNLLGAIEREIGFPGTGS